MSDQLLSAVESYGCCKDAVPVPSRMWIFHDFLRMYLGFGRSLGNLEVLDCCIYLQFEDSNFKAILLAVEIIDTNFEFMESYALFNYWSN